jgi:hypothetical protein
MQHGHRRHHRPHHVHVGHGVTANSNKSGLSVTQKMGSGLTVTTGSSGTTVTTTTGAGTMGSVTTQTRNGHTRTHANHKKGWFFGWF